jgi:hypothetical protein
LEKLDTPDLCARLDTLKSLCDRLESVQGEPEKYRRLVERIRMETEALRHVVCGNGATK